MVSLWLSFESLSPSSVMTMEAISKKGKLQCTEHLKALHRDRGLQKQPGYRQWMQRVQSCDCTMRNKETRVSCWCGLAAIIISAQRGHGDVAASSCAAVPQRWCAAAKHERLWHSAKCLSNLFARACQWLLTTILKSIWFFVWKAVVSHPRPVMVSNTRSAGCHRLQLLSMTEHSPSSTG